MLDRTRKTCSCCGQPILADVFFNAPDTARSILSPIERKVLQAVRGAPAGIPSAELYEKVMPDNMDGRKALAVAIWRLNQKLRMAGYEIHCGRGSHGRRPYQLREYRG